MVPAKADPAVLFHLLISHSLFDDARALALTLQAHLCTAHAVHAILFHEDLLIDFFFFASDLNVKILY